MHKTEETDSLNEDARVTQSMKPEAMAIPVLYEDEELLIVYKRPKLLVHKTGISKDKQFLLQNLRNQLGYYVYPVHRLDRPTSGLVMFAKNEAMLKELSLLFSERHIEKKYKAIVRGWMTEGVMNKPLKKLNRDLKPTGEYQEASTAYKVLKRYELPFSVDKYPKTRYSLIELSPKTGRYHQIRRHLKASSHPILGDTSYGKGVHNTFLKDQVGLDRLMLVAYFLRFKHPKTKQMIQVELKEEKDFTFFTTWAEPFFVEF